SEKGNMIFGRNTNVAIHNVVYHVQTEDRGAANALIETTVYCRGRVLHRLTNNYFDLLPLDSDKEAALKLRLDAQHRTVLEEMRSGALSLTPPPTPVSEGAAAPPSAPLLVLELTNAESWLKARHATPAEVTAVSDANGLAHLEFDMPHLSAPEAAIVIDASQGASRGHLKFQLRAKPRVPAT